MKPDGSHYSDAEMEAGGAFGKDEREPDGFCVWCSKPYFPGDPTYVMPVTREVHCTKACADDHRANL